MGMWPPEWSRNTYGEFNLDGQRSRCPPIKVKNLGASQSTGRVWFVSSAAALPDLVALAAKLGAHEQVVESRVEDRGRLAESIDTTKKKVARTARNTGTVEVEGSDLGDRAATKISQIPRLANARRLETQGGCKEADEVLALVERHWGKKVECINRLPSYDDVNWDVICTDGRFVLKLASAFAKCRGGCDGPATLCALKCENRMMRCINDRGGALRAPKVMKANSGEDVVLVGDTRFARLISFVDGVPLSSLRRPKRPAGLVGRLGRALASSVNALADLDDEGASDRWLTWDLRRVAECRCLLSYVEDIEQRQLVERALTRFEAVKVSSLPYTQLIHGDANDENLLISRDTISIIDFGDFVKAPRAVDLAIALAYALFFEDGAEGCWLDEAIAIVQAFHAVLPLEGSELDALIPMAAARNCQTVLNAAHRSTIDPSDTYVTLSAQPAWRLLRAIDGNVAEQAAQALRRACGLHQADDNRALSEDPGESFSRKVWRDTVVAALAAAGLAVMLHFFRRHRASLIR